MHCHWLTVISITSAIVMGSVSAGQEVGGKQELGPTTESVQEVQKRPKIGREDASVFFESDDMVQACHAMDHRQPNKLLELIDQGLDVNRPGLGGVTLLHWALVQGDFESFKLLLSRGASPDMPLTETRAGLSGRLMRGDTVLMSSALFGLSRTKFFLAALPYTKTPTQKRLCGQTLLHAYLSSPLDTTVDGLKEVLESGVQINAQDNQGMTALHYAIQWDRLPLCSALLDAGADPFLADSLGEDIPALITHQLARMSRRPTRNRELEKQLEILRVRVETMPRRAKAEKPADAS